MEPRMRLFVRTDTQAIPLYNTAHLKKTTPKETMVMRFLKIYGYSVKPNYGKFMNKNWIVFTNVNPCEEKMTHFNVEKT